MGLNYTTSMMDCVYCFAQLEFSPMSEEAGQYILGLILVHSPELIWDDPEAGEAIEAIRWEGSAVDEGVFPLRFKSDSPSANDLIGRLEDCAIAAQSDAFSFSSPYGNGVLRVTDFTYAESEGRDEPNDGLDGTEDLDIRYGRHAGKDDWF